MKDPAYRLPGSRPLMLLTAVVLAAGTLSSTAFFNPFKAKRKAALAQKVASGRQIKLCLDFFAMDHNGRYPCRETAETYNTTLGEESSNKYFRQLLAAGVIDSERLFWVEDAPVCSADPPDDVIRDEDALLPAEMLKAGDCGWAYMSGQSNVSLPGRPILLDAYIPGTTRFETAPWDGKVTVVLIDGSAHAIEPDAKGALHFQQDKLLDPKADLWKDSKTPPAQLLIQPLPAPGEPVAGGEDEADADHDGRE